MFQGFSPETIDFLWGIRMNNNREWFLPHKQQYIDALYEPYNRDIEIQNAKADRSNLSLWSFGVAAKHEVFFRRISMQVALGWYLSRPLNKYSNTTEEYPFYERIGLRYTLPLLSNSLYVGYNIYAHLTKAYGTELILGIRLPGVRL